jgi:dTDP-4-dehydrorhamnose reductase
MRVLLTGVTGQVGWELARSLMPLGEVVAPDRAACDLSRPETLAALVERAAPEVIVNAAAYTAVDQAEAEEALATTINGTAVGVLAQAARRRGALFIHYSTDYVFDGRGAAPIAEDASVCPLNAYGRSKLAGEVAVRESCAEALVLRTSWVYAARGRNFLRTILRLAAEREELRVVADQFGAPTWARNIADATAQLIPLALAERRAGRFEPATLHLTNAGVTSWHGFATALIEASRRSHPERVLKVSRVLPLTSADYPLPAPRPANSRLDGGVLARRYGLRLPPWEQAVARCIEDLS